MSFAKPFLEKRLTRLLRQVHSAYEFAGLRKPPVRTIFVHVPKCGGTSINWAAKSYLGNGKSDKVVLVDDTAGPAIRREQIARARDAMFVGGHFGFETLESIRRDAFVFTVLRDPYDRLKSVHRFLTTLPKRNPLPEELRNLRADAFFASREPCILQWTDNVIARSLALSWNRARTLPIHPDELAAKAIRNLSAFDFIADTRSLQDDMASLATKTGIPTFSRLGWHNVTMMPAPRSPGSPARSLSSDTHLRALAQPLIRADLAVYNHAMQLHQGIGPAGRLAG